MYRPSRFAPEAPLASLSPRVALAVSQAPARAGLSGAPSRPACAVRLCGRPVQKYRSAAGVLLGQQWKTPCRSSTNYLGEPITIPGRGRRADSAQSFLCFSHLRRDKTLGQNGGHEHCTQCKESAKVRLFLLCNRRCRELASPSILSNYQRRVTT